MATAQPLTPQQQKLLDTIDAISRMDHVRNAGGWMDTALPLVKRSAAFSDLKVLGQKGLVQMRQSQDGWQVRRVN